MPEASDTSRQGLFDPQSEHDACGVGFVARPDARPSHALVEEAVLALGRLSHRGGSGCGPGTADGAGLLLPLPRRFVERIFSPLCGGGVPERCAVGQLFLPQDTEARGRVWAILDTVLPEHGLRVPARRDVPIRPEVLQAHALAVMPHLAQIAVVPATAGGEDARAFERRLYVARRHLEKAVAEAGACRAGDFHVASLSAASIVYKGMIAGGRLAEFFPDLEAPDFAVHYAIFHERYSTNTRSVWRLAQPFRCLAHNGDINTLAANRDAMRVREPLLPASTLFGERAAHILPVLDESGSDSAMLDNALELLLQAGESPAHAAMTLLPEPFGASFIMGEDKRAFYEYHAALMEPWDGPAALVFTDGLSRIGAVLDRNSLRPARWCRTTDGLFLLASEAGVFDIPSGRVAERGRLHPRRMLMVDFEQGRVIPDAECKGGVIYARPYRHWVRERGVTLADLPLPAGRRDLPEENDSGEARADERLERALRLYGIGPETIKGILAPMARDAQEPIRSMGLDTPLAVLSGAPRPLFDYFKQRFAQVTNPPIDPLREGAVMSLAGFAGRQGNLLEPKPEHYARLRLPHPLLFPADMERLRASEHPAVSARTIPMLFAAQAPAGAADEPGNRLAAGLDALYREAEARIAAGATLLILSDAGADAAHAPIPSLAALSFLHARLTAAGLRHACGLIVDSGEVLEIMHIAQLTAFGADAVHPRLAFALLDSPGLRRALGPAASALSARRNYAVAVQKGLLKTISRMGISTLRGFRAGRGFEALGLGKELMERCFPGTPSRIGGIGFTELAAETLIRHGAAFASSHSSPPDSFSFQGPGRRKGRDQRAWTPHTVRLLHTAVREDDAQAYWEFAASCDRRGQAPVVLRNLLEFVPDPVPMGEVESAGAILRRFVGAAMSFGSISPEAHRSVAEAFNRVGGRSNCGEGGLPPGVPEAARSKIRQIASGRFGVDAAYLVGAEEIQIKMAQGAKPGEGGQLPAHKVTAEIAAARHTVPGVTLISPPPHHDIYSIEDLAQLIYDLKRLHPVGRVSVKLVAGPNIGTIAAGVAKAGADGILISGHDGGTGASPRSAVEHVGLPWELGLAEAHSALIQAGLRRSLRLQVDGLLRTGRDLAVAALLGADEFGFGTAALVSLGCCMLRICHLGTCPVGVAAQDARLRAKFPGRPKHLERYLRFVAEDLRGHMAHLGFRSLDEMIGRVDRLRQAPFPGAAEGEEGAARPELLRAKTSRLDLGDLLLPAPDFRTPSESEVCPDTRSGAAAPFTDTPLEAALLQALLPALRAGKSGRFQGFVRNTDRAVGVRLAGEVANIHGSAGLRGSTLDIHLYGTAGQSLGAFLPHGVSLTVEGEANDYAGKGLCGGRLAIVPPDRRPRRGGGAAAVGNVALYGATAGEFFAAGSAGGRFAVRNAGALAVVEGVGDHACEYMTGGAVVVLGQTGCNFAAGMSGGAAFVFDRSEQFQTRCNLDGVDLESVRLPEDVALLRDLLTRHHTVTGSALAAEILDDWEACLPLFLKVAPIEYRRSLARMKSGEDPHAEHSAATEEVYTHEAV